MHSRMLHTMHGTTTRICELYESRMQAIEDLYALKWLVDVYAEFGLYEAHVEGMWQSNSMIVGGCGD